MTILEAINKEVLDTGLIEKYCIVRSLDCTSEFTAENYNDSEIVKAYCFKAMATEGKWSEDGLSVERDKRELIRQANVIFEANGLESDMIKEPQPKISNKTNEW